MAGMDRIVSSQKKKAQVLLQNNQFAEARDLYERICAKNKMDVEARFTLGAINGQLGYYEDAIECFKCVVALQPSAEGFDNLGLAFYHLGQLEAAAVSFRQALVLNAGFARSHFNLGLVFKDQGNYAAAAECFRHAVRLMPAWFEAVSNLGSTLSCLGKTDESIECFKQALRLQPDNTQVLLNLADALLTRQDYQPALVHYQRALQRNSLDEILQNKVGIALQYVGDYDAAIDCFQRAVQLKRDFVPAYLNLGHALITQMKFDEALAVFNRALEFGPGNATVVAGIANVYEKQGDYEKSYQVLKSFVDEGVKDVELAVQFGLISDRLNRQADACRFMEHLLEWRELSSYARRKLHFGLGRLYDKLGDYDKAFSHFGNGNDWNEANPNLLSENAKLVDRIIATFNQAFLNRAPRSSVISDRPIFIVGMPRSGTSLVEQILASHPQVYGAGELLKLWDIVGSLPGEADGVEYPECISDLSGNEMDGAANDYLACISRLSNGAGRVTDKVPSNFFHLGLIALLFPGARVIHCLRNPMDTCLSCYFQDFAGRHTYSTNLEYLGKYYQDYQRLMAHWQQVLPIPMLHVSYEELIADPEAGSRQIIEYCGLEWDERCLRFYESKRVINTASYDQIRKPIYQSSVSRWKHYEKYLEPLRNALAG